MIYSEEILEMRSKISENMKKLRLKSGLTKKEIAKKAKIAVSTYKDIENNKTLNPNMYTLIKISSALGVRFYELL